MRILIVFGSTEGHTAKLADYLAKLLTDEGDAVVCKAAAQAVSNRGPSGFDRVLIMGSLHAGEYQHELVDYVRRYAAELASVPSAFVSVSLSAAGHERRDWKGLEACLLRFQEMTGWAPASVHQAAGAFRFTRYSFLTRFIMARIAGQRGMKVDGRRDYDLTDYEGLANFTREFVRRKSTPAP